MTTFALDGPINLDVRLAHGTVSVIARSDLTEATVEITAQPGSEDFVSRVTTELRGRTLVVHGPRQGGLMGGPGRDRGNVDVVVTVPAGTALKVSSFTADVRLDGRSGGADIATGTGSIDLDTVDGDLRIRCGTSTSSATWVTGSATVKTGAGTALFGEVGGALEAGCGTGRLEADVVRGRLRFRCGAGSATIGACHGDVDMASGSGELALGLPTGVSARLDVKTGSGRVRSELPIEAEQSVGNRAITIKARTGSGDVRLFSAA